MNNGTAITIGFMLGAAAGALIMWQLIKDKYEQKAQEEIDSVVEVFKKRQNFAKNIITKKENTMKTDFTNYQQKISDYSTESRIKEKSIKEDEPYVIAPNEFGVYDEYQTTTLLYFADGVLSDESYNIIDDVDNIIGISSLEHFGEYEDDSVYVRNDRLKSDYEILSDIRDYYSINLKDAN